MFVIWIDVGDVPLRVRIVPLAVMAPQVRAASAESSPKRKLIPAPTFFIAGFDDVSGPNPKRLNVLPLKLSIQAEEELFPQILNAPTPEPVTRDSVPTTNEAVLMLPVEVMLPLAVMAPQVRAASDEFARLRILNPLSPRISI